MVRRRKSLLRLREILVGRRTSLRSELTALSVTNSVTSSVDLVVVVGISEGLGGIAATIGDNVVAGVALGGWGLSVTSAVGGGGTDCAAASSSGVGDVDGLEGEVSVEGERSDLVATESRGDLVVGLALSVLGSSWCTDGDSVGLGGHEGRGRGDRGGDKGGHRDEAGGISWDDLMKESDGVDRKQMMIMNLQCGYRWWRQSRCG